MTGDSPATGAKAKEKAAAHLRSAILAGDVSPGQRLVEAELAETTAVTRGSARAAIDSLVAEGLVERIHNRGARVRIVPLDEAISMLECRAVLEGLTAFRAAEKVTEEQIVELRRLREDILRAVANTEFDVYSRLNSHLHSRIGEISGQTTAIELISRLRSQLIRHQFKLAMRPGRPQVSVQEHVAIIDAVIARDPVGAERAARAHVDSVAHALRTAAEVSEVG